MLYYFTERNFIYGLPRTIKGIVTVQLIILAQKNKIFCSANSNFKIYLLNH